MNQELLLAHRGVDCLQAWRRGVLTAVLFLAWAGTAAAAQGSLQDVYKDAEQLAATPAGREQAIAGYQTLIETHLKNEALFDAALPRLARCYLEAGKGEEGIRFFENLGAKMFAKRGYTFRDVMNQFGVKYPEHVKAAWDRMTASARREDQRMAASRRGTLATEAVPVQELVTAILQRNDADPREKALARLRMMLAAESPDASKKQGLATLHAAITAKFGRQPFRALVMPLLRAQDPDLRALALRCLPGLDATIGDLALVLPLVADPVPEVRVEVGPALLGIGQGKEPEKVIPALTTLLRDSERSVVERTLSCLEGRYSSPEFDEILIEVAKHDREYHGWVICSALSPMRRKSPAVCRRLVEELSDPDSNRSGRAAWGLTFGIPEEAKPLVEDGLLKALPEETNDYTRENELRALREVGTEKSRSYLQSVIDSPSETDKFRQLAREVLASLDRRP